MFAASEQKPSNVSTFHRNWTKHLKNIGERRHLKLGRHLEKRFGLTKVEIF
jgi:hypothetical protein